MSRFWWFSGLLFLTVIVLLAAAGRGGGVDFTELETECRYDRGESHSIELTPRDTLNFSGVFPVRNTAAELGYSYSGGDVLTLDIRAEEVEAPESYVNDCLGVAVYKAETPSLDAGTYTVELLHDGDRVEKQVIEVS